MINGRNITFYPPQKGVIGFLMGEGYVREGAVYFLECAPRIIVPILPSGVIETTEQEYNTKWRQNWPMRFL